MEHASNFQYYCESCSVRGTLVQKIIDALPCDATLSKSIQDLEAQISMLQSELQELKSQLSKLQVELDGAKTANKKQFDRLLNKLHSSDRATSQLDAQNRLVANIGENLEIIERGAKLANTCSQAVNSCRLAINKLPFREGENVRALVDSILTFLEIESELPHVMKCFRLPVKPSKWTDRSITPTVIVVFDSIESRQMVLRRYFEKYKEAKLCNIKGGPSLEYRFTMNEVLSTNSFRIRNYALRLKQSKFLQSVFVRSDRISVLLPGQKRYLPIESMEQLHRLTGNANDISSSSSVFFDAMSVDISATASSHC